MKIRYYFAAAAAMMLGACSQEKLVNINTSNKLFANIETEVQSESRIAIEGLKVNWTANDAFSAFSNKLTTTPATFDYKLSTGDKTSSATFACAEPVSETLSYAIYPALTTNTKKSLTLEHYDKRKKDFILYELPNEYAANSLPSALPMIGKIEGTKVSFTIATGVAKLTINNLAAKYTKIELVSEEGKKPLAGKTRLGFEDIKKNNIKWIMNKDAEPNNFTTSLTINRAEGQSEFYVPVPVSTSGYKGITVKAHDDKGAVDLFKISFKEVVAGSLYKVNAQDASGK